MEDSVTVTVDRSPLDGSSSSCTSSSSSSDSSSASTAKSSPAQLVYSDISDDEIPPPPTVPHPDVIRGLNEPTERPEYQFSRPLAPVPSALVTWVQRDCGKKIPILMKKLLDSAARVGDGQSFRNLLAAHRKDITLLIRIVRNTVVRYLKNNESTKSELDSIKFAFFKRLAVWRDQIDNVVKLSERQPGWSEERRQMLWRRLLAASRWRMMGLQMRDTFFQRDIVEVTHD
jgi:hypothetical protein